MAITETVPTTNTLANTCISNSDHKPFVTFKIITEFDKKTPLTYNA